MMQGEEASGRVLVIYFRNYSCQIARYITDKEEKTGPGRGGLQPDLRSVLSSMAEDALRFPGQRSHFSCPVNHRVGSFGHILP